MAADALLLLAFGGPESPDDVMPFLRRVTAGRGVPEERLASVAHQYAVVGGVSPLNAHTRKLVATVTERLRAKGDPRPVYYANRNTEPFLAEVVAQMAEDGVGRATVFVPSAYSSYSSCRQYLDDLADAAATVGPSAPVLEKIPPFWAESGLLDPMVDAAAGARDRLGNDAVLVATAHSLPKSMADACDYEAQLRTNLETVRTRAGFTRAELAFQSRSGRPDVPWLEPDVGDLLEALAGRGVSRIVLAPIGFVHEHMEVIYDLDRVAVPRAEALGSAVVRIPTPGADPRFAEMVVDLFEAFDEASRAAAQRCRPDCCASR